MQTALIAALVCLAGQIQAHSPSARNPPGPGKWEETGAYALSLGATVGSVAAGAWLAGSGAKPMGAPLAVAGIILGPSAGQFQAGSWKQGLAGSGVRLLGAGLFMVAMSEGAGAAFCEAYGGLDDGDASCSSPGPVLPLSAFAVYAGGALYSLVDTHFAFQRKRRRQWGSALILEPAPGGGDFRSGARAFVRF